jgi:hypothetical protein
MSDNLGPLAPRASDPVAPEGAPSNVAPIGALSNVAPDGAPSNSTWRPSDLEAIRVALAIPVTPASIRAINDQMMALEASYPDAIPVAKGHLDAIAALDNPPLQPGPGEQPLAAPQIRKVTRKGAAVPIPDQLPQKKLDVVEYATELLMEEVSTEYAVADAPVPAPPAAPAAVRRRHAEALLLILPGLVAWQPQQVLRFSGLMIRG